MMRRIIILSLALTILMPFGQALAISAEDQQSLNGDSEYYWGSQQPCNTSTTTTTVSAGSGAPDGASFPNLDPTNMANAINTWVKQQNPNSELNGLGTTIVADGSHSNVNPFLIVAIAKEESSLSDPSDFNVSHGNNSFGRTAAAGQPSFQGSRSWYKWSSVQASVDYTAPENQGITGGGDMATYLRDQYSNQINSNNLLALMEAYAPPSENNTAQYISNIQAWTTALINLATGNNNSTASNTATTTTTGCGTGAVNCSTNQSSTTSTSNLSQVRQNVVCIAQQELATWQSQPGYPWNGSNSYSQKGYLIYSENRQEEWCADFASWVYDQAQYPLRPDPNWNISYVPNIQAIGQQNKNFHFHQESTYVPKPGDLAIYGGNHVNIVVSVSGNTEDLIGGDQGNGPYPGGSIVSEDTGFTFFGEGITGYVTPD